MSKTGPATGSWRGTLGSSEFPVEADRYHLYASLFCPFAGRVLLTRELKGLHKFLPVDIVRPFPKGTEGWRFPADNDEYPGATVDRLFHSTFLNEIYRKDTPSYNGPFSVPLLWDKKTNKIVNNESEDIMRMLNTAFDDFLLPPGNNTKKTVNFYPPALHSSIDAINAWLVPELNTGVYKAGFAPTQEAYGPACEIVFSALQHASDTLSDHKGPYMLGSQLTELDLKLYSTLIRFDTIYVQHFKLNLGTIRHDYPVLNRYLKHLYWKVEGFRQVTDFMHIKENYSKCHKDLNPKAITPLGPRPNIEPWTEEDEKWRKSL
ncbi:MAG: hypothetical protein M1827_002109 [Pycnora praestabilis]|nr:MAG: hypothetical protein M1827_002109 [Pycnora praestabilis]